MTVTLILSKGEKSHDSFISWVSKKKHDGVCVLMTRPYSAVSVALKKKKINLEKLFFIDTVGKSESKNVVSVSVENLTALSISIKEALQSFPKNHPFLIFDSISILALHNDVKLVTRFLLFIINKLREWKFDGCFIVDSSTTDASLLSILKQSVDRVEGK